MTTPAARRMVLAWLVLALAGGQAQAADEASLQTRVERLERMMGSRGLLDMLADLEQLQREVQQLRGEIEVQGHTLGEIQRRQRELYMDVDRRVHALESGGGGAPPMSDQFQEMPAAPPLPEPPVTTGGPPGPPPLPVGEPRPLPAGGPPAPAAGGPPPLAAGAPAVAVDPVAEREDYEQALNILKEGRYAEAADAFRKFLSQYPASGYADNAQYWLGESYYVTRQYDTALSEFRKVVQDYPQSSKGADAQLKIGYIQYEKRDWAAARETLTELINLYPDSTAARLANERLQRMKREGH
jgi:tol-pal system protein YbgF